jgi:hypothetical protein
MRPWYPRPTSHRFKTQKLRVAVISPSLRVTELRWGNAKHTAHDVGMS